MAEADGGFTEGLLQSDDGKKAVVMVGHEVNLINFNSGSLTIDLQSLHRQPSFRESVFQEKKIVVRKIYIRNEAMAKMVLPKGCFIKALLSE